MATPTSYTIPLSDEDRLYCRFQQRRGRLINFVIQYHSKTPKCWRTVIRYDTKHSFAHRDIYAYSKKGKIRREVLGKGRDYKKIATEAQKYIKEYYRSIKENFMFQ